MIAKGHRSRFRQFLCVLSFFGMLGFAAVWKFALQGGTIGHNWDWAIPPLPVQLRTTAEASLFAWRETALGSSGTAQLQFLPLTLLLTGFGYLGLSGDFVSKFLIILVVVLSGVSMFYLVRDILTDRGKDIGAADNSMVFFSSLLAGFFYAGSPFLFADLIGGAYTQVFAYSLVPLAVYLFRKMARSGARLRYAFLLAICLSLLSMSFNRFSLTVAILFFYVLVQSNRATAAKGLLAAFFLYIPLNAYWIVPSVFEVLADSNNTFFQASPVTISNLLYGVPSYPDIFVGVGYFRPFFNWVVEDTIPVVWAVVSYSLLGCLLASILIRSRNRESIFWLVLYGVSLLVTPVGNSPIADPILWAYENVPLMSLFRSPQHLVVLTIVPLSVLIGIGAHSSICLIRSVATRRFSLRGVRKATVLVVAVLFLGTAVWVFPMFTGNLGADQLQSRGGGNFVNTFTLSPDLENALRLVYGDREMGFFRTLFLPPASSPYFLETKYQNEGQGGDVVILSTQGGVSDVYVSRTEPIISHIRDSFILGEFRDPWMLEVAAIRYIVLRNDVIPHFGPEAGSWNYSRTLWNLYQIPGLGLIYEGEHVLLWKYGNHRPLIYAADRLFSLPAEYSDLLFSPTTDDISVEPTRIADFESDSQLSSWFAAKNFNINLSLDSQISFVGNRSLRVTYDKSYGEGGGNLNYEFASAQNLSDYRWVSSWIYYPGIPLRDAANVELILFDVSWNVLIRRPGSLERQGWNHLAFELAGQNLGQVKFIRLQFYDAAFTGPSTTINVDNLELISFTWEPIQSVGLPELRYQRLNPTEYIIHVSNASRPFYLVFSEAYQPLWKLYLRSGDWLPLRDPPLQAEHVETNGYANTWYIDPGPLTKIENGTFSLILRFETQGYFYLGAIAAFSTFASSILYLSKSQVTNLSIRIRKNLRKRIPDEQHWISKSEPARDIPSEPGAELGRRTDQWPSLFYGNMLGDPYVRLRLSTCVELLGPYIRDHCKILDIGCYTGDLLTYLPPSVDYYGLDADEQALKTARARGAKAVKIDLETGDIPLSRAKFDIVVATEILEHLRDPARMMQQIKRLVAPDGVVLISLPNECTIYHRLKVLLGHGIDATGFAPHYHLHFPTIRQSEDFVSQHCFIVDKRFWHHLGTGLPARVLSLLPRAAWDALAATYPTLLARGTIFLCRMNSNGAERSASP